MTSSNRRKVVFVDPAPKARVERIAAGLPADVVVEAVTTGSDEEVARLARDASVLVAGGRRVDEHLMDLAPQARLVYRPGAGFDSVDISLMKQRGVLVANSGGASANTVAEHTLMLMLAVLRRLPVAIDGVRAGRWPRSELLGTGDLDSARVGIVGLGSIGQAVAHRLHAFGSVVGYYSRHRVDTAIEARLNVGYLPLDELLSTSAIVTVHMPLNEGTRHFFGRAEFTKMPQGAIFINTAKGELADEPALLQALQEGHLGGAGLDVVEREAEGPNPLYDLPNVVVTPHVGGASRMGAERGLQATIDNIAQFLRGETPGGLIPELRG